MMMVCGTLAGGLVAGVSNARAARSHSAPFSFGREGSGEGEFKEPTTVAVQEANDDVYVVDAGNNRVQWFTATGVFQGQFNGSGTLPNEMGTSAPEPLNDPQYIAVDNSCQVHKPFALTGEACEEYDRSDGDIYIGDPASGVVDKFTPEGVYISQVSISNLRGVAVDAHGTLWVVAGERNRAPVTSFPGAKTNEYSESETRELTERESQIILASVEPGFAVDSADDLYVNIEGGANFNEEFAGVSRFTGGGVALEVPFAGVFEVASGVGVELASGDVYVGHGGSVIRYTEGGEVLETLGLAAGVGSGVGVGSTSETVYVVDGAAVEGFPPSEPGAPVVVSESLSAVTSESATFTGEINPDGAATQYRFEYGRCVSVGACVSSGFEASIPVPDAPAGSDFEIHTVGPLRVLGLTPGSVYHYRIVAHNVTAGEEHVVDGGEEVFVTQGPPAGFVLPDSRSWELVSPPDKHGARLAGISEEGLVQAAAGGEAVTYEAFAPVEGDPLSNANMTQVLSTRSNGGWSSSEIAGAHEQETGAAAASGVASETWFFSRDLSRSVLQPFGGFVACESGEGAAQPCLSAAASEQSPFLYTDFAAGDPGAVCTGSCALALVTGCPEIGQACPAAVEQFADVAPGTTFGQDGEEHAGLSCPPALLCGPQFQSASPDGSHVLLKSVAALVHTTPQAPEKSLYEWNADAPVHERLQLVSVLPDGVPATGGFVGSVVNGSVRSAGAVSGDGSRVVWSSAGKLYLRDVGLGQTVQLDAGQVGCGGCGSGGGVFQFAAEDGSRVLFSDEQRLTSDSGAEAEKPDLYECEVVVEGGVLGCALRDLTPFEGGEAANVQGAVLGASRDGSWVYFVADGIQNAALNTTAVRGTCSQQGADEANTSSPVSLCDVYVRHGGVTRLVGVLSGRDFPDWSGKALRHTAGVSPDGGWLAFMSSRSLTGYDNRDVVSGKADEEVFLYDAASGGLACGSCDPSGARPTGVEYTHLNDELVGGDRVWPGSAGIAGNIPGWTAYRLGSALYQSRFLSDSGRLFFNSSDGLVPEDVDGGEDVYEYEPVGVGSCGSGGSGGAVVGKPERGFTGAGGTGVEDAGCVGLVSAGSSPEESAFVDASESGGDVFFLTSSKLVSGDVDSAVDVYDARECAGGVSCAGGGVERPGACLTEASCRAAPSPQPELFGAPASGTFAGGGNPPAAAVVEPPVRVVLTAAQVRAKKLASALKACRRKAAGHGRRSCEALARRRYGPAAKKAKAKKAGRVGKAGRAGKAVGGGVR